MITTEVALWGGFTLFILAMLALDLGVFHRKAHVVTTKEALIWFGVWTGLALIFNLGIVLFHERGGEAGLEFFTGYLVEKALSVDNIFVFILIFGYFQVPQAFQHKVLFWGIVGALVLRVCFIIGGLALLERFHWMIYLFGAFLLFSGIQMMRKKNEKPDPDKNWIVQTFRKFFPVSPHFDGNRFFTRIDGRLMATPLFIVLLAVESSDIIFAVDSIPAIFAVTQEPFLVFTSNVFAMLGLRALYFAVSGFMQKFHLLHYGFASILVILGTKMLLSEWYKVPVAFSLVLVMVILFVCVILSLLRPRRDDLKMMFERPEKLGLIPFRRLLLIENVVDLGDLTVRDSMRHRSGVHALRLDVPWEENVRLIRETNFSRYPLVENANSVPLGVVHVKDLFLTQVASPSAEVNLRNLARPFATLYEDAPLDDALANFQRTHLHFGVVQNADGDWTGILTIEDVLEEVVGKIGDEFDVTRSGKFVPLADTLTPGRVVFGVGGASLPEAVGNMLAKVPKGELPASAETILEGIQQRESLMTTYLGCGLAIPHCRLDSLDTPVLVFGRSEDGIPLEGSNERAELIFLLLTPSRTARIQPRLLADITGLIESEYVTQRLKNAERPEEIIEAISDGQRVVLD